MALDHNDASGWKNFAMELLFAEDQARGGFYLNEMLRQGNANIQDVQIARTAYETYKTTRNNRPALTAAHEDTAFHSTTEGGKKPVVGTR